VLQRKPEKTRKSVTGIRSNQNVLWCNFTFFHRLFREWGPQGSMWVHIFGFFL